MRRFIKSHSKIKVRVLAEVFRVVAGWMRRRRKVHEEDRRTFIGR